MGDRLSFGLGGAGGCTRARPGHAWLARFHRTGRAGGPVGGQHPHPGESQQPPAPRRQCRRRNAGVVSALFWAAFPWPAQHAAPAATQSPPARRGAATRCGLRLHLDGRWLHHDQCPCGGGRRPSACDLARQARVQGPHRRRGQTQRCGRGQGRGHGFAGGQNRRRQPPQSG